MARAHYFQQLAGRLSASILLTPLGGATVNLYQEGTSTPIAQPIYSAKTGAGTYSNPLTASSLGIIEFWLEEDERLDTYITAPNFDPLRVTVDVVGANVDILDPRDFDTSKQFNDSDDNTVGIQAAVDSIGSTATAQRTGRQQCIKIPPLARITNTVTVARKSLIIQGSGWGLQDGSAYRSYIRWDGAAGIPVLKIQDCANTHVRNLRFVGNITNKPSAAVNFNQTGPGGFSLTANSIEDVMIGLMSNTEGNLGDQFVDGILLDGYPNNNAELLLKNLKVNHVSRDGYHSGAIQSVDISMHGAYFSLCGRAAIYNCGYIVGTNVGTSGNAIDVMHPFLDDQGANAGSRTQIRGFFSEAGGRLADLSSGLLALDGSSFALTPSLNVDGKVIKNDYNATTTAVELRNLRFFTSGSPPTAPYLAMSPQSSGSRHIVLDNCGDWNGLTGGTNGMDVATTGASAQAYVFYRGAPTGVLPVKVAQNFISGSGKQWDINRFDLPPTGIMGLGTFTTATRPAAASYPGSVIYVSDGAGGSKFQGSDGSSWVSLG